MSAVKALTLSMFLGASALVGSPSRIAAQEPQEVVVVVDNQSYFDMHVYAVQGGVRRSLGLATGISERSFVLPRTFVGRTVQILAEPIGPRTAYLSDGFYLVEGQQMEISLHNNLNLSSATVSD